MSFQRKSSRFSRKSTANVAAPTDSSDVADDADDVADAAYSDGAIHPVGQLTLDLPLSGLVCLVETINEDGM